MPPNSSDWELWISSEWVPLLNYQVKEMPFFVAFDAVGYNNHLAPVKTREYLVP